MKMFITVSIYLAFQATFASEGVPECGHYVVTCANEISPSTTFGEYFEHTFTDKSEALTQRSWNVWSPQDGEALCSENKQAVDRLFYLDKSCRERNVSIDQPIGFAHGWQQVDVEPGDGRQTHFEPSENADPIAEVLTNPFFQNLAFDYNRACGATQLFAAVTPEMPNYSFQVTSGKDQPVGAYNVKAKQFEILDENGQTQNIKVDYHRFVCIYLCQNKNLTKWCPQWVHSI